jgi:hypothetical protein
MPPGQSPATFPQGSHKALCDAGPGSLGWAGAQTRNLPGSLFRRPLSAYTSAHIPQLFSVVLGISQHLVQESADKLLICSGQAFDFFQFSVHLGRRPGFFPVRDRSSHQLIHGNLQHRRQGREQFDRRASSADLVRSQDGLGNADFPAQLFLGKAGGLPEAGNILTDISDGFLMFHFFTWVTKISCVPGIIYIKIPEKLHFALAIMS